MIKKSKITSLWCYLSTLNFDKNLISCVMLIINIMITIFSLLKFSPLKLFFFPIPQSSSRILSLTTWFSNLWMSSFVLEHGGFNHSRKFQHWIDAIMDRLVFMGSFDGRMQSKSFSILWNIEELFSLLHGISFFSQPNNPSLKSSFLKNLMKQGNVNLWYLQRSFCSFTLLGGQELVPLLWP